MISHLREPLTIPRWVLSIKYAFFILFGIAVEIASSSTIDRVFPYWYTGVWAGGVTLAGILSLIGSLRSTYETLERVGCVILASFMLAYAIAPIWLVLNGDTARLVYAVVAVMFTVLPVARAVQLIRRTGIRDA